MKLLEQLQRRGVKYILIAYILITLVYTSTRFYDITGSPHHRTARRSVVEPITELNNREDFFVAPLAHEVIESDEYEELVKATYFDNQQRQSLTQKVKSEEGKVEAKVVRNRKFITKKVHQSDSASLRSVMQEKAFASALGPSDLQPFYYRASEVFQQEDITLSTIVTSDRFPVLSRLATRYKGKKEQKKNDDITV